jgi:hypothetical protein
VKQFLLTPSASKRLIAKAIATHPTILNALKNGTCVIVAGTTNGYVAEEVLKTLGVYGFSRQRFFRGLIMPPDKKVTAEGRLANESQFPGDVVIVKGVWQKGKTIADVVDSLIQGDVILKGANAVDLTRKQAAVLIGHPKAGTMGLALPVVVGRRVKLIIPVGLEKRVNGDLQVFAEKLNAPGASGYRLLPVPGEVFTELEALKLLFGVNAELVAAGGVCGAEGSCLLSIAGTEDQENAAEKLFAAIEDEPAFTLDNL